MRHDRSHQLARASLVKSRLVELRIFERQGRPARQLLPKCDVLGVERTYRTRRDQAQSANQVPVGQKWEHQDRSRVEVAERLQMALVVRKNLQQLVAHFTDQLGAAGLDDHSEEVSLLGANLLELLACRRLFGVAVKDDQPTWMDLFDGVH